MSYFKEREMVGVTNCGKSEESHGFIKVIVVEVLRNPQNFDKLTPL